MYLLDGLHDLFFVKDSIFQFTEDEFVMVTKFWLFHNTQPIFALLDVYIRGCYADCETQVRYEICTKIAVTGHFLTIIFIWSLKYVFNGLVRIMSILDLLEVLAEVCCFFFYNNLYLQGQNNKNHDL